MLEYEVYQLNVAITYSPRFPQEQRAQGESFILSIGIVTLLVTLYEFS